jgi:16S rRNA (adenine(1408)-N(1))-methyltransferase
LLRGLLTADAAVMTGLTRIMRPGAGLSMLLSATDRDRGIGVAPIGNEVADRLAEAYGRYGLRIVEARRATAADVAATHSSWGKRLGAGTRRPAWLLRAFAADGTGLGSRPRRGVELNAVAPCPKPVLSSSER